MKVCLYFNKEYYFISDKDEEESKRKSVKVNDWNVFLVEKWDSFDGSILFEVGTAENKWSFVLLTKNKIVGVNYCHKDGLWKKN